MRPTLAMTRTRKPLRPGKRKIVVQLACNSPGSRGNTTDLTCIVRHSIRPAQVKAASAGRLPVTGHFRHRPAHATAPARVGYRAPTGNPVTVSGPAARMPLMLRYDGSPARPAHDHCPARCGRLDRPVCGRSPDSRPASRLGSRHERVAIERSGGFNTVQTSGGPLAASAWRARASAPSAVPWSASGSWPGQPE